MGVRNTHYHNTLKLRRSIFIAFKISTAHSLFDGIPPFYIKGGSLWFTAILENTECQNTNASYYTLHPWKISQWSYWRSKSCGTWRRVIWWVVSDVSEGNSSLVFIEHHFIWLWRWRWCYLSKRRELLSEKYTASQSGRAPSPNQAITRSFKGRSTRPGWPQRLLYTAAAQPHSKEGCSLTVEMRRSVCPVSVQSATFPANSPVQRNKIESNSQTLRT
jgi:hypothetical protein